MLENLLNTKLKKSLLEIFFQHPKRSFSLTEPRELSSGRNPYLGQALREFWRAQVLDTATRKQKKLYQLNSHFALFDELKDLAGNGQSKTDDKVAKLVRQLPGLKFALLGGVFTLQPDQVLDLLLVGDNLSRTAIQKTHKLIEKLTGLSIVFSVLTVEEYEYRKAVSDRFIRDIEDYPHIIVTGAGRR